MNYNTNIEKKSKIPKNIIQTGYAKKCESSYKNKIIKMNPLYKYEYYNNNDCIDFLKKNFHQDVTTAFNKLKPGAFKADLFRYCYLYKNGGVYIDLDIIPLKPLDKIIVNGVNFISCLENRPFPLKINGIYQGFIACVKNLFFFRKAIDTIVYNTKNNYNPKIKKLNIFSGILTNILSITGPVLLYNSMNFKKRPLCGYTTLNKIPIFLYRFNRNIYDLNNKRIMKNGIPYVRGNNYYLLYMKKQIYN